MNEKILNSGFNNFKNILYPESYIHVTPSFYFPKVVYVDDDDTAINFFSHQEELHKFVNKNKRYKDKSLIKCLNINFKNPLKLKKGYFDLLIALHQSGIREYCKAFLKKGGVLLQINYQFELFKTFEDKDFKLIAVIDIQGGYHELIDKHLFRYKDKILRRSL